MDYVPQPKQAKGKQYWDCLETYTQGQRTAMSKLLGWHCAGVNLQWHTPETPLGTGERKVAPEESKEPQTGLVWHLVGSRYFLCKKHCFG